MNNNVSIYYEKKHVDDVGSKIDDIFSKHIPDFIGYRKIWSDVIDGFKDCTNSDLMFTCTEGNMRIIVADKNAGSDRYSFNQYFLSELDGKVVMLAQGTRFAVQNIDQCKSSYLLGYSQCELRYIYTNKNIFDWRRKLP